MEDLIGKKIHTRRGVWTIEEQFVDGNYLLVLYDGRKARLTPVELDHWIDKWGLEE
jgi:hypothetical protein